MSARNTIERVLARLDRQPGGCWLWTGARVAGYGHVAWHGKPAKVHRLAWEHFRGPIPEGLFVCHTCDVPACANPDHLFVGTAGDNVRDAVAKGRHAKMVHTHCPKGHEYTAENTRHRTWSDGRRSKFCATCYRAEQRMYRQRQRSLTR